MQKKKEEDEEEEEKKEEPGQYPSCLLADSTISDKQHFISIVNHTFPHQVYKVIFPHVCGGCVKLHLFIYLFFICVTFGDL